MIGVIKAGLRARRNKRVYEKWLDFYAKCPVPPGISCAECEKHQREIGTVEQCKAWVSYYEAVLS